MKPGLLTIILLSMVLPLPGPVFRNPMVLKANAAPPSNPALLGLFSETKKSNVIIDSSIGIGATFAMDVNVTDAGPLKAYDVNITFASASVAYAGSSFKAGGCTKTSGCLFDGITTSLLANTTSNANAYRLSVVDTDTNTPFVGGTGILFRMNLKTKAAGVASVIHITSKSIISNPATVPYNPIDGYFDSRAGPSNYSLSLAPRSATIIRKVSGQNSSALTVSLSGLSNVGTVTLKALGLPINSNAQFNPPGCSTACTSTLTIAISGGPKGAPSTTPSGTYFIPIIGNSTATGVTGFMEKSVWLLLIIRPPKAPVYSFSASATSLTQEAGGFSIANLSLSLTSGANDTIALTTNCLQGLNGVGTCSITPSTGSFPLTAMLNVSTLGDASLGSFRFNATATTAGTYSEVVVVQNVTFTLNLLRTHDIAASNVVSSRNFAYSSVSLLPNPLRVNVTARNMGTVSETFTVNATAKTVLRSTSNLKWIDPGGNTLAPYASGETVVQDTDGNGVYGLGKIDPNVVFSGSGSTWTAGNAVVYDADGDGVYMVGKYLAVNDTVIAGTIANNTLVKIDPKLAFIDCTNTIAQTCDDNGLWDSGETVFYDSNGNTLYDSGETIIAGTAPVPESVLVGTTPALGSLLSQNSLSFVDSDYDGVFTSLDPIAYDADGSGVYDIGEPVARGSISAGILVGFQMITLAPSTTLNVTFLWDPGSLPTGSYIIGGYAMPVTGEYSLANNAVLPLSFTERLRGDVNGDCKVEIVDLVSVGGLFGKSTVSVGYNPSADLNNDGIINIIDLVLVAGRFGQQCP